MTKKNRIGMMVKGVVVTTMSALFIISPSMAYAKSAPLAEGMATYAVQPEIKKKKNKEFNCKNKLANWIYDAGFRGHNIREAWSIAMRESNGIPTTISGSDHGLFQFNYGAWGGQSWWDTASLLTPEYNAKIAFKMSNGGKSWIPWGMRDHMDFDTASYAGIWSSDQFYAWVIEPYQRYYAQYPCK